MPPVSFKAELSHFPVEADMLAPIAAAAKELLGARSHVFFEVPAAVGVPDIVVAEVNYDTLLRRVPRDFLTSPVDLAIVLTLSRMRESGQMGAQVSELASVLSVTPRYLRSTVLPDLQRRGHIHEDANGWGLREKYESVAIKLLTVEAKLRDWKKGIAQASRQVAGADEAWLVLDRARHEAALKNLELFRRCEVGLATISTTGVFNAIYRPANSRTISVRRELLAERVGSFLTAGTVSGPVAPVFGAVPTVSKGCDPRLTDALAR